ncbi:MAG: serine/threonine protein kinase, partial [Deltaproteobacteria bacterium]|nr:serine/threonine protein kinase [Deltaproteobacteria bacterium]MBW2532919.1 serine/threonine protein kinase [Deltaproteobacteria bacterium]
MATALLVRDQLLDRELALKLLELPGTEALQLFRDEFVVLSGLAHPRLTRVHDFGSERGDFGLTHFYTADRVEGATLDRFVLARSWPVVARPLCDALHALAFLHALGIRHGDFKPDNVIVCSDGRGTLIDLGCAGPLEAAPSSLSGTPAYMAPELLDGGPVDGRADLYSVGVTLDELLRKMAGEPPAPAVALADRLTRREPSARPAQVAEVLELLGDHEPVVAAPAGRAPRLLGRERELER